MGLDTKNDSKEKFLKEIVSDISKIIVALHKIPVKLDDGTQELINNINYDFGGLLQSMHSKELNDERVIKGALNELDNHFQKLSPQLKKLPYSDQALINSLCKAINTLLEKLADFFMNGPLIAEGVYIPLPDAEPHHFDFFHPSKSINPSVEDLSEKLSSSSKSL